MRHPLLCGSAPFQARQTGWRWRPAGRQRRGDGRGGGEADAEAASDLGEGASCAARTKLLARLMLL